MQLHTHARTHAHTHTHTSSGSPLPPPHTRLVQPKQTCTRHSLDALNCRGPQAAAAGPRQHRAKRTIHIHPLTSYPVMRAPGPLQLGSAQVVPLHRRAPSVCRLTDIINFLEGYVAAPRAQSHVQYSYQNSPQRAYRSPQTHTYKHTHLCRNQQENH
jgi:hypothetical protein